MSLDDPEKINQLDYKEDSKAGTFECKVIHKDGTELTIIKQTNYHFMTHKERANRILQTYLNDTTLSGRAIAKLVGCTESTVRRNLAKHGYKLQGGAK